MTRARATTERPRIAYVTGVDDSYFYQIFLLLGSLLRNSPSIHLYVCDFGLTDPQRDFLRRRGMLVERPLLGPVPHVFCDKGVLADFLAPFKADAFVWLDSDILILGDIAPMIEAMYHEMVAAGEEIAIAPQLGAETLALQGAIDPAPYYASRITRFDPHATYFNIGFFLCRSRRLLERWAQVTRQMPLEPLFEQNAFNILLLEDDTPLRQLDPYLWNLCGPALRSMKVAVDGRQIQVTDQSGTAHVLHATSSHKGEDLVKLTLQAHAGDVVFEPCLRVIAAPRSLWDYQCQIVADAMATTRADLVACGFGAPAKRHAIAEAV